MLVLLSRGGDRCLQICGVFCVLANFFVIFLFHGEFFGGLLVLLVPLLECLAGFCVAFLEAHEAVVAWRGGGVCFHFDFSFNVSIWRI